MFQHEDCLDALNQYSSLNVQLETIHDALKKHFPFVVGIAVASYYIKSGMLKTCISNKRGRKSREGLAVPVSCRMQVISPDI